MRDERTYKVIGCGMEVHKELGCGILEEVYQEALGRGLAARGVPFKAQPVIEISYKGKPLKKNRTSRISFVLKKLSST